MEEGAVLQVPRCQKGIPRSPRTGLAVVDRGSRVMEGEAGFHEQASSRVKLMGGGSRGNQENPGDAEKCILTIATPGVPLINQGYSLMSQEPRSARKLHVGMVLGHVRPIPEG